eukprot:Skav223962  [mRNA]  locus=scaffold3540:245623:245832:- [translate_table: standard]
MPFAVAGIKAAAVVVASIGSIVSCVACYMSCVACYLMRTEKNPAPVAHPTVVGQPVEQSLEVTTQPDAV